MSNHTPAPWAYKGGCVYTHHADGMLGSRLLMADRDNPDTSPAERDCNLKLAVRAVNSHDLAVSIAKRARALCASEDLCASLERDCERFIALAEGETT